MTPTNWFGRGLAVLLLAAAAALPAAEPFPARPAVKQDPGYDLLKDFAPVGPMIRSPLLLVVAADQQMARLVSDLGLPKQ